MNPLARKKWVNRQVSPVKDRLNELDQLTAKNANDIKDVDSRAQAGIHQAQTTADQQISRRSRPAPRPVKRSSWRNRPIRKPVS